MKLIEEKFYKGNIENLANKNGYMGIGINFLERPYLRGDEVYKNYRLEKLECYAQWGLKKLKSFAFLIADEMAAINYATILEGEPTQYLDEARIVANVFFQDLKSFLKQKNLEKIFLFKMTDISKHPFYSETKKTLLKLLGKDKLLQQRIKKTIPEPIWNMIEEKVSRRLHFLPKEKSRKKRMISELTNKFSEYALEQIIFSIFMLNSDYLIKIGPEREAKFDKILYWLGEEYKDKLKVNVLKNFGTVYFKELD